LAVEQRSVTVTAGLVADVPVFAIQSDPSSASALWRIGDWDGSPQEFLNGDKLTTMHPSDVRMHSWTAGAYAIGGASVAGDFPAYQWQGVNPTITVHFVLSAEQVRASTLRVGITTAFAGGRPQVRVNGWSAPIPAASVQPATRTLTVGSYRGNNTLFLYSVPSSALQTGDNVLTLSVASGSGGSAFLSPGIAYDAIDWVLQ
jgi:rhamnogalacturonan endolyase